MKKHFWKLEYSITIFIILGICLLIVPFKFENYFQADMTSSWAEKYEQLSYTFSVINAQKSQDLLNNFKSLEDSDEKEKFLSQLIKPYLRLKSTYNLNKRYKPKFLDNSSVDKDNYYYFDDLYYSSKGLVGIKNLNAQKLYMMMVDINGIIPPNTWGKDIFGIYVLPNGIIEPFGYNKKMNELSRDCSKSGTGVSCSYYYLIGGEFND